MPLHHPFPTPLVVGRFLRRYKRFFADVELPGGQVVTAHCANTGSMQGLLVEGAPALLHDTRSPTRKLQHAWKAVQIGGTWVGIDTSLPNALVAQAVQAGVLPTLCGATAVRREQAMGANSRVDLVAEGPWGRAWVEVKNVTLAAQGLALFPDAVTERGRKHLDELAERVREGDRAAMVYVLQRGDVTALSPADAIDPAYGQALRRALAAGVEAYALGCRVDETGVKVEGLLPVRV